MKLHVGCGPNYKEGWINIDSDKNHRCDLYYDLTKQLPFQSETIRYIYSQHFIEHLTREQGIAHLQDCFRVLKNKGTIRISCPDLYIVINNYIKADLTESWIKDHPQVDSPCQYLNIGLRAWGHQYVYDESELNRVLKMAGFSNIQRKIEGFSNHPELCNLETRSEKGLILEATK